jgi:putative hydrolase of the HAD superfamily
MNFLFTLEGIIMIKRIIFDIDNTLLDTNKDAIDSYQEYFNKYHINYSAKDLYDLIEMYDRNNGSYNKQDLEKFIANHSNITIDLNKLLKVYSVNSTLLSKDIPNTLNYLSKKYDLVCLTAWYEDSQASRLKKAHLLKYFNKIYGFETAGVKPDKKAFITALNGYLPNECLMVGDSINSDIKVASELGMNVYYLNKNNTKVNYPQIKKISELKVRL